MSRTAIICIEDEQTILNSLGEQLQRGFGHQYEIEMADNGADAIALCAELVAEGVEIAVIISDHFMPGMTGDRLLIELHHHYSPYFKDFINWTSRS